MIHLWTGTCPLLNLLPSLPFAITHVAKMVRRELNNLCLLIESTCSDLAIPEDQINSSRMYRTLFMKVDHLTQTHFLYNLYKQGKKVDWSLVTREDTDLPLLDEVSWKDLSKKWSKKMELMGKFEKRANPISNRGGKAKDTRTCFICQKKGHVANNCWYNTGRGRGRGRGRDPPSQKNFTKSFDKRDKKES